MVESLMPSTDARISLREITVDTVNRVIDLYDSLTEDQQKYLPPNAVSIAQAHYLPKAWLRVIYADETPVGFLMLYDDPDRGEYFLWRLMIARPFQRKGFGSKAVRLLADYVRNRPRAKYLCASFVPMGEGLATFYEKNGFEFEGKTGRETAIRLQL